MGENTLSLNEQLSEMIDLLKTAPIEMRVYHPETGEPGKLHFDPAEKTLTVAVCDPLLTSNPFALAGLSSKTLWAVAEGRVQRHSASRKYARHEIRRVASGRARDWYWFHRRFASVEAIENLALPAADENRLIAAVNAVLYDD